MTKLEKKIIKYFLAGKCEAALAKIYMQLTGQTMDIKTAIKAVNNILSTEYMKQENFKDVLMKDTLISLLALEDDDIELQPREYIEIQKTKLKLTSLIQGNSEEKKETLSLDDLFDDDEDEDDNE